MKGSAPRVPNRIVTIGEPSVGKTSILNRVMDKFDDLEQPTVGAAWQLVTQTKGGQEIELQIWDTAGQEKFRALGPLYYRGAVVAVVVYDVTNRASFDSVEPWIEGFTAVAGSESAIVVVGNKTDLEDARDVSQKEGRDWAIERGLRFFETSAKTGANVKELFEALAEIVATRMTPGRRSPATDLIAQEEGQGCC
jgi:small GTP-binding protein